MASISSRAAVVVAAAAVPGIDGWFFAGPHLDTAKEGEKVGMLVEGGPQEQIPTIN